MENNEQTMGELIQQSLTKLQENPGAKFLKNADVELVQVSEIEVIQARRNFIQKMGYKNDCILTPADTEIVIYNAKLLKYSDLKIINYMETINLDVVPPTFTADQILRNIHAKEEFTIDEENINVVELLCLYFSGDPEFEKLGYSLKKGIMLSGPKGVGKSTLMKLFRANQVQSYALTSCRTVAGDYQKDGYDAIAKYSRILTESRNIFNHKNYGYCFDDLGTEGDRKHFGDQMNVMREILLNRYDKCPLNSTFLTTNLTPEEITNIYGDRVFDRCIEMFNSIEFSETAKSRRK
jgi:DNA replication protein DnaC